MVNLLKSEPLNNLKLRTCVIRSLALANVQSYNIDFVIEILFQQAQDQNAQIRKASIVSLDILHKKASND